jgi:hypothetical protein
MPPPIVITVVFHPADEVGERIAAEFISHFDKLGMERAGASTRVPVRLRAEALGRDGALAPIRAQADNLNVIVVIYGLDMLESAGPWLALCQDARRVVAPLLGMASPASARANGKKFSSGTQGRRQARGRAYCPPHGRSDQRTEAR